MEKILNGQMTKKIPSRWVCAVDLGKTADYTAIGLFQLPPVARDKRTGEVIHEAHLRHLERLPLKQSYVKQVSYIGRLMRHPRITINHRRNPELVVDATGVGKPVVDMFREAGFNPCAVTITGGQKVVELEDEFGFNVPKRDLATNLIKVLQKRQLKVSRSLTAAQALIQEMLTFKLKLTAKGNDTYEAWRESDKDDLVLMLAIGAWYIQYVQPPMFIPSSVIDELEEGEVELPKVHTGSYR